MTDRTDDALVVVRCQLGERAAFDELVQRWHRPVWSFLAHMLGDAGRSDDLAQEVWVRVVRGLPRLEQPDQFAAWVFTIARRVVHDDLRRSYRTPDADPLSAAHPDPADQGDPVDGVLDRLDLERALAVLSPRDREATVLFHLQDRPVVEVAELLGVPEGTVKSRLHRARRQLAHQFPDRRPGQTTHGKEPL